MAKVINSKVESNKVTNYYPLWQIICLGVGLGLLNWGLTALIGLFTTSSTIPGDVATILVATIGIIALVKLEVRQPLIIAIAAASSLWGMSALVSGLSIVEIGVWNALLYTLAYVLFSWVARYKQALPVLCIGIVIVIIVRIIAIA